MGWTGEMWHRLRSLAGRSGLERGLSEEIRFHIDQQTEKNIRAGMDPAEARRQALIRFGGVERMKEHTRDEYRAALLEDLGRDLRYGARALRRSPGFTIVASLTLALGIGANTAIFSVVHTVLLKPLAYREPERLVFVWERNTAIGKDQDLVSPPNYLDWQARATAFESLGGFRYNGFALSGTGDPESLTAITLSSSLFRTLAVEAAIGRTFTADEERRGDRVVVLTHGLWQRRFGGDPSIVGRAITLTGASFTVVGVMPPQFRFPDGQPVDLYAPLVFSPQDLRARRTHSLTVIGRLKPGVTLDAASADVGAIARGIAAQDAGSNPDVLLIGAHDLLVQDVRLGLIVLLGTVGFVLLIACANVANLLLVRASARRGEMAVRAALGAGRLRLIRQMLTESVLLAGVGGVIGVSAAWWALRVLVRLSPPDLPRIDQVGIDGTVLIVVTIAAAITGVAFGLAPALQGSATSLIDAMQENRAKRHRGRSALIVSEIALSLVLLAGAGLMLRSFVKARSLDLGFRSERVVTAQIFLPGNRYPVDSMQSRPLKPGEGPSLSKPASFYLQLIERLQAQPGIESAGAVSALPLNPVGIDFDLPIVVQGRPPARTGEEPQADFRMATPGYFRTMGIPLVNGREFTEHDGPATTPVVVINDTLARQIFPDGSAVGQRLLLYGRAREIVGVIGSVRHHGFGRDTRPEMILPSAQFQLGGMTIVVRTSLDAGAFAAALGGEVRALDPALPISRVRLMDQYRADSVAQPRFTTLLLGAFAALAVALALVGVYGVMSYTVSQRTREIGVRMALGAKRQDVVWMVVRHGMLIAGAGIVVGLAGAAVGTRVMERLLFGVTATDLLTFVLAGGVLAVASLAATYIPALRAARVMPIKALRSE